jgi:prepilin-type processing-associated H-X9-DG protein
MGDDNSDDRPPPSGVPTPVAPSGVRAIRIRRWLLIIAAVLVAAFLYADITSVRNGSSSAPRVQCTSNLRQLGQAIFLYADEHNGAYLDSLGTILLSEDITPDTFICPATTNTVAKAPTTQAEADDINAGRHVSYLYLGNGFNTKTTPTDAIVAYEPLSNHGNGMNLLFGDGHVEFIDKTAAAEFLSQISTGTRPVRWPTTKPAGQ